MLLMMPSACSLLAIGVLSVSSPAQEPRAVAITHVTVIDVALGQRLPDRTVVLRGRLIRLLGPSASTAVPSHARVVDGRGRFLIPGLWDMHVHVGVAGRSALKALVANGVTSVREMGGGFAAVHAWRDSIAADRMIGPRIRIAGPILESARWRDAVLRLMRTDRMDAEARDLSERIGVGTAEEAHRAVDSVAALGADFVKVRTEAGAGPFFAILSAARAHGLRVVGHPPTHVSLEAASDSGMASFEHGFFGVPEGRGGVELDSLGAGPRATLFRHLARNHTAVTPTLVALRGYRLVPDDSARLILADSDGTVDPRRPYVAPQLLHFWSASIALKKYEGEKMDWAADYRSLAGEVREMSAAGVPLLAGTDLSAAFVFPGFSLHDELWLLVRDGGLTPAAALRAATLTPATFLGAADSLGTIAPGKLADLVLLDADPLSDIRNTTRIRAVIADGHYLGRTALDSLLASVRTDARPRRTAPGAAQLGRP